MFIKTLIISSGARVIREIEFHKALNLIVDESSHNLKIIIYYYLTAHVIVQKLEEKQCLKLTELNLLISQF